MYNYQTKKKMLVAAISTVIGAAIINSTQASPFNYGDESDAPAPYGKAWTSTGDYQRLGQSYGIDDGVSWSLNGGLTFGHEAITIGQTVKFKFDLYSHNIGGHVFDPVRAWFDSDANGSWSNNEMIFSGQYDKATNAPYWQKGTPDNPYAGAPYQDRTWRQGDTNDWIKTSFYTDLLFGENFKVGQSWLRARATCDASIGGTDWYGYHNGYWGWHANAGDINLMGPTGYLHQGEAEDYKITVLAKPVVVPPVVVPPVVVPPVVVIPEPPVIPEIPVLPPEIPVIPVIPVTPTTPSVPPTVAVSEPSELMLFLFGLLSILTLRSRKNI